MKTKDLLEMKLKDLLEKYCIITDTATNGIYGITTENEINKLHEKYQICEDSQITYKPIIRLDTLIEIENNNPLLKLEQIEEILNRYEAK